MKKNRTAQSGETGNRVTRSGYAMKARPLPLFTTSATCKTNAMKSSTKFSFEWVCKANGKYINSITGTPSSSAMKPKIEKIANPAKTEVMLLPKQTIIVSLKRKWIKYGKVGQVIDSFHNSPKWRLVYQQELRPIQTWFHLSGRWFRKVIILKKGQKYFTWFPCTRLI